MSRQAPPNVRWPINSDRCRPGSTRTATLVARHQRLCRQRLRQVSRSRQFDGREIEIIDGLPDRSSRTSVETAGTGTGKRDDLRGDEACSAATHDRLPLRSGQSAIVLAAVKDKPFGWPRKARPSLTANSTRWRNRTAVRSGDRSAGVKQKNGCESRFRAKILSSRYARAAINFPGTKNRNNRGFPHQTPWWCLQGDDLVLGRREDEHRSFDIRQPGRAAERGKTAARQAVFTKQPFRHFEGINARANRPCAR